MSSDWRPRKGCRLMATWPVGLVPPDGWHRSEGSIPLIWHIATGGPEDQVLVAGVDQVVGYTETTDCGVSSKVAPRG